MNQEVENINPYGTAEAKHAQVRVMFDSIAPAYDVMNRMMTFGVDRRWRRKAVAGVAATSPRKVLDIATGTGDLAMALARALPEADITGVDLSEGMLELGRAKVERAGMAGRVTFSMADALALPFDDNSFDAVTVAYGVRNFEHLDRGYAEMLRVLRPGGMLCVLELSVPASALVKPFYAVYTGGIIPLVGRMVSRDARAYSYLPRSIRAVPAREAMTDLMAATGFTGCRWRSLTMGVCTMYTALKPD